jgi:capsular exopolysaccharide synthesis family protein
MTGFAAYEFGARQTPMYASSATMMVSILPSASLDTYNANLLAKDLSATYQSLVTTDPVLQAAAGAIDPPADVNQLRDATSVTESSGALFVVSVVDPDPNRAAALTGAVTTQFISFIERLGQEDDNAGKVSTLIPGKVAESPYAPRLPAYLALGIIGGLLLASSFIFLMEQFDTRVRATSDLPAQTGLVPLARIPRLDKNRLGTSAVFLDNPQLSPASEAIRTLRNAVLAIPGTTGSMLVVASPGKGDGKTLVAVNLAAAMSRTGKRVVLVDGHLREPQLHKIFHLDNVRGLGTLLSAPDICWETVAQPVAPNFTVVPAGTSRQHPGDLLMSPTFDNLIDDFLTWADVVILDTPAIDTANDSIAVSRHGRNVILVCRNAKTRIHQLRGARESLEDVSASVLGVVVNRERNHRSRHELPRLAFWHRFRRQARRPRHALADARIQPKSVHAAGNR